MKSILAPACAALILACAAPALASPIDGLWQTPEKNGTVRIYDCGGSICGKIVNSDNIRANPNLTDEKNRNESLRTRPMKDLVIINGVSGGPREWKGGSVYNPEDGGTYHGSLTLIAPDTLKLTGCVIYPFCKSEVWRRIKE